MLKPLFDRNCELIGWLKQDEHIFSTSMESVAYIKNGHVWSANIGLWIGPVHGLVCLDTSGRVVAWNPDGIIRGTYITSIKTITPFASVKTFSAINTYRWLVKFIRR